MTIVARYRAQDQTCSLEVNGQQANLTIVALTDKTLSSTWVGRSHSGDTDYFNGDIAGLYVTDEYASDEKSALIADALEEGLDLTELPCNNCQSRHLTTNCSAHVTNPGEGPEGNNIEYLDRHNVQCPANKVSPPTCCDDCSREQTSTQLQTLVPFIPPALLQTSGASKLQVCTVQGLGFWLLTCEASQLQVLQSFKLRRQGTLASNQIQYEYECCAIAPKFMVGFSCQCDSCK
jgi:hypothetical protein